jgi:hypothetical protein
MISRTHSTERGEANASPDLLNVRTPELPDNE